MFGSCQGSERVTVKRDEEETVRSFATHHHDLFVRGDGQLGHPHGVRAALSAVQKQFERCALIRAQRPLLPEGNDLVFRPRTRCIFGRFDASRRMMLEPSNVDGVADQYPEHFQNRKRGARSISIGWQDDGDDEPARQARECAVRMSGQ